MTNGQTFNVPTVSAVVSTMAIAAVSHPIPEGCELVGGAASEEDDWMEMEVVMGFRVWQLMFLALAGLITVVVLLCCFMKCRVPRTKQEIEADFKRKEITKRFRFLLDKVQVEDTSLRTALEKVNELYRNREKVKLSKKKKEIDEEDIEECSFDSNELFAEEKLTIIERIKRILRLEKEKGSDTEEDSAKTEQGKESEAGATEEEEEDDDDESGSVETKKTRQRNKSPLPQQKTVDSQDTINEDSPKRIEDIRSTLSLLQDSPPPGSSSRISLLQDSPPHSNLTLLQDSPPPESTAGQETLRKQKSDSQESDSSVKYRDYTRSKTDSQESRESQRSEPLRQKSSDSQDSKSSELRKQLSETQDSKKSEYRRQEATDSQDSRNGDLRKQKSDSQESKRTDSVKNNSDSQDSKTSHSTKQKSDSQDSKATYPKRNSSSQDSKTSSNAKTDSVDSTKSYGTRQKSDSQEFKSSNHRRLKSNSHDSKSSDSPKQNKIPQDSSKHGDSIRQLSDPQDSTNGYRLGNRRESLATNTTLLKDFARRDNERLSKERKNNSFPSTSKLRRTSSKDLNMMCSNSKETSFLDTNLTNPVTEELKDNMMENN